MKRAVSISIGSSRRDKSVEVTLLGERIRIERIGTDGDMEAAAHLFRELDGKVDAFGVGGADLGTYIDGKYYPFHSVQKMVRYVHKTPIVDGGGLKNTLENNVAAFLELHLKNELDRQGRKVMVTVGIERWGLSTSFAVAGYQIAFCDLMFALGLPFTIRSINGLRRLGTFLVPVVTRLPFSWLYPTGDQQDLRKPRWEKQYRWATVVAGDCHYIRSHIPDHLPGKIIVTNTTTSEDVALFKQIGIHCLVTTTPILEDRTFGTNMMEAALVALSGKERPLEWDEYESLLNALNFTPELQILNPSDLVVS